MPPYCVRLFQRTSTVTRLRGTVMSGTTAICGRSTCSKNNLRKILSGTNSLLCIAKDLLPCTCAHCWGQAIWATPSPSWKTTSCISRKVGIHLEHVGLYNAADQDLTTWQQESSFGNLGYTLENERLEPKNGGLVQMICPFNWMIFTFV